MTQSNLSLHAGTPWKMPTIAMPRSVVQMIAHDGQGNFLIMHRSNNVRSARNIWSFPTGEHDIGETLKEVAARELMEEFGLKMLDGEILGVYENIAGDSDSVEQYHWVLNMLACRVSNLSEVVNKEPDKHDQFVIANAIEMMRDGFFTKYQFHDSTTPWLRENLKVILDAVFVEGGAL